jgi:tyrosine-specific transport protein
MKYTRKPDEKNPVAKHHGIFRKQLSLWEGVSLITSGTIGAGMLAIPYAVAQVGIGIGLVYIFVIGLLMIGLNLMIGEVTVRTKARYQVPGLARKYLGKNAAWFMTAILYIMLFGVQLVYIIGVGESFDALFGGGAFRWSLAFFAAGMVPIIIGLRTIKIVELLLMGVILLIVTFIAGSAIPAIQFENLTHISLASLLLPYGVILFGYHGVTSIPETHSLLVKKPLLFKKSIIYAGFITMAVCALFAILTVGVLGTETTEIATIGLGRALGTHIMWLGNLFALLAMGTSFLMTGVALRDSFVWDFKLPVWVGSVITAVVPITLFLLGLRQFIAVLDIIGGVLVSTEMLLLILIYWRAKQLGDLKPGRYKLHHTAFLAIALIIALSIGAGYSVYKLF